MGELEELQKRLRKLKAEREVREAMTRRTREKAKLKSQIRKEKYAKLYSIGRTLKKSAIEGGKRIAKAQRTSSRRRTKNPYANLFDGY